MHSAAKSRIYLTLKQVVRIASTVLYVRIARIVPYVRLTSTALCSYRKHCALWISWVVLSYTELGGSSRNVPASVHETINP